jgi:hypothetical protein
MQRSRKRQVTLTEQPGLLAEVLSAPVPLATRADAVVVGTLAGRDQHGGVLVDFPGCVDGPVRARSLVGAGRAAAGREVALLFEQGDRRRPIVIGFLEPERTADAPAVEVDGERVELTAEREIVLRCGKASITLTRAGKVLIRGEYVLSRASGVHRIKGGAVQIN